MRLRPVLMLAALAAPAHFAAAFAASYRLVELDPPRPLPTARLQGVNIYFGDQRAPAGRPLGLIDTGEVSNLDASDLKVASPSQRVDCDAVASAALIRMAEEARRRHADAVIGVRSPQSASPQPHYVCQRAFTAGTDTPIIVTLTGTAVRLD